MNIIVCLDDRNGMLFHRRRQSADAAVCRRMLEIVKGKKLFMNSYSAKLFADIREIHISEDFLNEMGADDWAFVEDADLMPYMSRVKTLVVFRWNRIYPRDVVFPLAAIKENHRYEIVCEFPGKSHEVITEERYVL